MRLVRPAKAGHAGTLDPLATGVLVVCVGHATRLVSLAQEGRKRYIGRFVLGQCSDTDDVTGKITSGGDCSAIQSADVAALLPEFVGRIQQVPPQFSAVHVQGRRAYALARQGETVEIAARPVDVYSIRLLQFQLPEFELEIECGSGTYIRSIGRDLGIRLGCGAIMKELRRTAVGPFRVDDAISLEELTVETLGKALQPALRIVEHLPQRQLTADEVIAIRRGQTIVADVDSLILQANRRMEIPSDATDHRIALVGTDGNLLAIGESDLGTHRLHPRIVFPEV